jgi:hypothetical protein
MSSMQRVPRDQSARRPRGRHPADERASPSPRTPPRPVPLPGTGKRQAEAVCCGTGHGAQATGRTSTLPLRFGILREGASHRPCPTSATEFNPFHADSMGGTCVQSGLSCCRVQGRVSEWQSKPHAGIPVRLQWELPRGGLGALSALESKNMKCTYVSSRRPRQSLITLLKQHRALADLDSRALRFMPSAGIMKLSG